RRGLSRARYCRFKTWHATPRLAPSRLGEPQQYLCADTGGDSYQLSGNGRNRKPAGARRHGFFRNPSRRRCLLDGIDRLGGEPLPRALSKQCGAHHGKCSAPLLGSSPVWGRLNRKENSMASVDIVDLGKRFGPVEVLHDVNMSIADGEFIVLV